MGWEQIVVIAMAAIKFGIHLARRGEPMGINYDPGATLIIIAFMQGLLWSGGFYGH